MISDYIIKFFISFIVSFLLIPIIIHFADKKKIYDHNDERKIHNGNICRLGGLAIFAGFIIPFFVLVFPENHFRFNVYLYTCGLLIAFSIGFLDDLITFRARYKLIFQIIAGIFVSSSGLLISDFNIGAFFRIEFGVLSWFITVVWVVAFMNAVNLLDGMDGLASGIIFIANIFIMIIALSIGNDLVAILSAMMCGSILGFYVFNYPPAKLFMGDGGAYFLGFIYSTLPLMGLKKSSVVTLFLFPLILLIIPIFDIVVVIVKRLKLGYNVFIADKNHIHHRLLNLGFSIKGILFILYSHTVVLGIFSILITKIQPHYSVLLLLLIFLIMFIQFYLLNSAEKILEQKEEQIKKSGST